MRGGWPLVSLAQVLRVDVIREEVDASRTYPIAGIYSFGRGLFARTPLPGSCTTYKFFHRLRTGQFVLSQLKGWEGALGKVDDCFDGHYLSPQFITFSADAMRLDIEFLSWYCKQPSVWCSLQRQARGMGARRDSVSPDRFLSLEIPLPPLDEQRRIVARLDRVQVRVGQAAALRSAAQELAGALRVQVLRECFRSRQWPMVRLSEVCTEIIDCLHSNPVYADTGVPTVRSPDVGWGHLNLGHAKLTSEAEFRRRTARGVPAENDIILVREGGGTGRAGTVLQGQRLSLGQRVMLLRPNRDAIDPRFMLYQWLSPGIQQDQVLPLTKGSASPHLNIGAIRNFRVLVPTMCEQRRVVDLVTPFLGRTESLQRLFAETAEELEAVQRVALREAFARSASMARPDTASANE